MEKTIYLPIPLLIYYNVKNIMINRDNKDKRDHQKMVKKEKKEMS